MLQVSDLTVSYGTHKALDHVSFSTDLGEVVGIVGPNGSGKTTLFKTMMSLIKQDNGSIDFNGKSIPEVERKEIGYLAEIPFQFEFFSPTEMLLFERSIKDPLLPVETIYEMLHLLDLDDHKDVPIKNLSQGLKKRVSIASTFISGPSLLILDEPLNALDIQTVIILKKLIREASSRGAYVLISSHILTFFDGLIQKIIFLDQGKVRHITSKGETDAEEVYKTLFMPDSNLF